jgi:serine palmitoyltransferase
MSPHPLSNSTSSTSPIAIPSSGRNRSASSASRSAAGKKFAQFFSSSPKSASKVLLAAQEQNNSRIISSSPSLPTISLSTATADTSSDPATTTTMLFSPPSPEQSRKLARQHAQFGPLTHPSNRYVSRHPKGKPVENPVEDEPPQYYFVTTYVSYLILIIFGHVRDWFGKRFKEKKYSHLKTQNVC